MRFACRGPKRAPDSDGWLVVRGLTGGYTQAPILRDIDLDVRSGEIVALFGANGAGKTSLLRALSGTLPRVRGDVELDGRPIQRMAPWHRVQAGLAHAPEGRHVFGSLSVRENLLAGAIGSGRGSSLEETYELFPSLRERDRQLAATLSGGEQQMLAIGRALMTKPALLLIDEMSAGLAPVITQRLVTALTAIRDHGVTILLVE